jgi:hypothetical protein
MDYTFENLKKLLKEECGRFSHYQELPPCVENKIEGRISDVYTQSQLSLDELRYDWLVQQVQPEGMSVVEIGSNLGYFVLRLSSEYDAMVEAYEPVSSYAKVTTLMAQLCGVNERVLCHNRGVIKSDLVDFLDNDLIITLNVLHHAGIEYDCKAVIEIGGWENYIVDYLSILKNNGKRLFLQMGNISSGDRLFPMEESVPYVYSLLKKSGWIVQSIGLIEDFKSMEYSTYGVDCLNDIPVTSCSRNASTGMVDYFRNGVLCASLYTGLAARPLWYCVRKDE